MWTFNKRKRDTFEQREKQQRVWRFIRRLIDLNSPNTGPEWASIRTWERSNRCLPVAFIPGTAEDLDPNQLFFASTKELSDSGLSLVTPECVDCTHCICGFWLDSPKLISGIVRRVSPFGGKMFEVGIELVATIESAEVYHLLDDQMQELMPVRDEAAKIAGAT